METRLPWSLLSYGTKNLTNKLCECIVLAEFNIDTGSEVKIQYPSVLDGYTPDWLAEKMLPEGVHNREKDYTYILLNRDNKSIYDDEKGDEKRFLYGINYVWNKHDSTVRRGAVVKAIAIFSCYHFIDSFKKILEMALTTYYNQPTIETIEELYNNINSIDTASIPYPNRLDLMMMRRGVTGKSIGKNIAAHCPQSWYYDIGIEIYKQKITVSLPLYNSPDELGGEGINVCNLVKLFGPNIMKIYNALLSNLRIMFVGYNHAAQDVCHVVLSVVAMVSPCIPGIIKRTFPYSTISDLSFLECPGYISGVTNPMFTSKSSWWDVLCVLDLPNNTVSVETAEDRKKNDKSKHDVFDIPSNPSDLTVGREASSNGLGGDNPIPLNHSNAILDDNFFVEVHAGIANRLSEAWVRQKFIDYTANIINYALMGTEQMLGTLFPFLPTSLLIYLKYSLFLALLNRDNVILHENVRKDMEYNVNRAALVKKTLIESQNVTFNPYMWVNSDGHSMVGYGENIKSCIQKLTMITNLHPINEIQVMYSEIARTVSHSEEAVRALLVLLPESQGGIVPLAVGLFHPNPQVRIHSVEIMKLIRKYPSTKYVYDNLNSFIIDSFSRQEERLNNGTLLHDVASFIKSYQEETVPVNKTSIKTQVIETDSMKERIVRELDIGTFP
jgi:hypothetical protein